jgi:hypothetical protein
LWSGLSLHPAPPVAEVRCCPSSLYTFPPGPGPLGLGSGLPAKVSPSLGSSASRVSRGSTQSRAFKSVASTVSPRPRDAPSI